MTDLELELRDLAAHLDVPPTPSTGTPSTTMSGACPE